MRQHIIGMDKVFSPHFEDFDGNKFLTKAGFLVNLEVISDQKKKIREMYYSVDDC